MDQSTTNRKELFHTLNEVTKELRKKIYSADFVDEYNELESMRIGHIDQTLLWQKYHPKDKDEAEMTKAIDADSEPSHGFNYNTQFGLLIGLSWVRVRDHINGRSEKTLPIIVVGSKAENQSIILRTSLKWYDHLRPSVIRMKGLIEDARRMRVKRKAIAIEHHLAKIVPDRIDSILLEGEDKNEQA